jgi:hypothetical protein
MCHGQVTGEFTGEDPRGQRAGLAKERGATEACDRIRANPNRRLQRAGQINQLPSADVLQAVPVRAPSTTMSPGGSYGTPPRTQAV